MSALSTIATPPRREAPPASPLQRLERRIETLAPAAVPVLALLFSVWAWFASRGVRFEFDEFLELSAAKASTLSGLLAVLRAGADFNPPLSHFLIRLSMSFFGDSEWAARFPAFLGYLLLLVCTYIFVSRWLSRAYGLLAIAILVCLPVREYAVQARPYGLMLGFSALAILLCQRAVSARSRLATLAVLCLCTACLAATHYYALLTIGAIFLAELARAFKKPDWALLSCIAGPPAFVVFLLRHLIAEQRHQLTNYFARGNILSFDHGYDFLDMDPIVYCLAIVLAILLLYLLRDRETLPQNIFPLVGISGYELLMGVSLLLLPIFGAVCTQFVTHAYVTRYFLPAAIGFSICVCYCLKRISAVVPGILVLSLVPLGLAFGKDIMQERQRSPEALPPVMPLEAATAPILFDTPGVYMEVLHYYPQLRDKIWVIADPAAQMHYRHYDTDDKIMLALTSRRITQAISLKDAAHRWSHFSLIPRSGDSVWALQCVINAGAQVRVPYRLGDSNFIFDVSVTADNLAQIDSCGRD